MFFYVGFLRQFICNYNAIAYNIRQCLEFTELLFSSVDIHAPINYGPEMKNIMFGTFIKFCKYFNKLHCFTL